MSRTVANSLKTLVWSGYNPPWQPQMTDGPVFNKTGNNKVQMPGNFEWKSVLASPTGSTEQEMTLCIQLSVHIQRVKT